MEGLLGFGFIFYFLAFFQVKPAEKAFIIFMIDNLDVHIRVKLF